VNGPGRTVHLARRFLGSLRPGAPSVADQRWAEAHLRPGEVELFRAMSNPDRRHAVGVARAVAAELGDEATRAVIAAALLHDVGKIVCGYRTPSRVVAIMVWAVVPDQRADVWLGRRGPLRGLAAYRRHPVLGEQLIRDAGGDEVTARWAAEHHLPADRWSLDPTVAGVLKACDDD
jgi:hypothetical protein